MLGLLRLLELPGLQGLLELLGLLDLQNLLNLPCLRGLFRRQNGKIPLRLLKLPQNLPFGKPVIGTGQIPLVTCELLCNRSARVEGEARDKPFPRHMPVNSPDACPALSG